MLCQQALSSPGLHASFEPEGPHLCRQDDPEPLKLLKRKMALAIEEEDYVQAAGIRDHPYMALHLESLRLRLAGRPQVLACLSSRMRSKSGSCALPCC